MGFSGLVLMKARSFICTNQFSKSHVSPWSWALRIVSLVPGRKSPLAKPVGGEVHSKLSGIDVLDSAVLKALLVSGFFMQANIKLRRKFIFIIRLDISRYRS